MDLKRLPLGNNIISTLFSRCKTETAGREKERKREREKERKREREKERKKERKKERNSQEAEGLTCQSEAYISYIKEKYRVIVVIYANALHLLINGVVYQAQTSRQESLLLFLEAYSLAKLKLLHMEQIQ